MVQANLVEIAKQGNEKAIATLINRHLQSQGITAKVALKNSCLQVLLESATVPDEKALAPFIFNGITKLAIEAVDLLQVFGRQVGEKYPNWSQAYTLGTTKPITVDKLTTNIQDTTNVQENNSEDDIDAVATHLNHVIADEKVTIKVIPEDKLLKIIAETNQLLDGQLFGERIYKELKNFDLSQFETVGIYKQKLKSGQCFQLKAFSLTEKEQPAREPEDTKPPVTHPQTVSTTRQQATKFKPQHQKATKPKFKIGRILAIVAIVIIGGFVIIRLLQRLFILVLLSPAFGGFSVILGVFFIWRNYPFLMFLFQKLLNLLIEE